MAEWLKKLVNIPLQYGLTQVNHLVSNSITLIFNLVGNRLFKMDNNPIIKNNACANDKNFFYFYPLELKESSQDILANTINLCSGSINELVIVVPWRTMLSDQTVVNIGCLKMTLTATKKTHAQPINIENSYFSSISTHDKNNDKKTDLYDAYLQIYVLLVKYFNQIRVEIKCADIILTDCFRIVAHGLSYDNGLMILEKLTIYSLDKQNDLLAQVEKISYEKSDLPKIIIDLVDVNPMLVQYLPTIYFDDAPANTPNMHVTVKVAKFASLNLMDIGVLIGATHINVTSIKTIIVDKLVALRVRPIMTNSTNQYICNYNINGKKLSFLAKTTLKINNVSKLIQWIQFMQSIAGIVGQKLVWPNTDSSETIALQITGLCLEIIYRNNLYNIQAATLNIASGLKVNNVIFRYDEAVIICDVITQNQLMLNHYDILNLNVDAIECRVNIPKLQLIHNQQSVDVVATRAIGKNITKIIEIIQNLVTVVKNMLSNPEEVTNQHQSATNQHQFTTNIYLSKSRISYLHKKTIFEILVLDAKIQVSNIILATDIWFDLLMKDYYVANVRANYFTMEKIIVDSVKLYVDPQIFDEINYLLGTLTPETSDNLSADSLDNLYDTLSRSSCSNNLSDFENQIDLKIAASSAQNIKIIENYIDEEWSEKLELGVNRILARQVFACDLTSVHIYLFDKLTEKVPPDHAQAFLCAIVKNISLKKLVSNTSNNQIDKYLFDVKKLSIFDVEATKPFWRNFFNMTDDNALNATIVKKDNTIDAAIVCSSVAVNIREETLIRLLAFFSNSHHMPKKTKPIQIKKFDINDIYLTVNYRPIIFKNLNTTSALSLNDFKLKLSGGTTTNTDLTNLLQILCAKWKTDLDLENILQFIPNIKIIKPYAQPLVTIFGIIFEYFKYANNRQKIRALTKKISKSRDLITNLVLTGVNHIYDLFK